MTIAAQTPNDTRPAIASAAAHAAATAFLTPTRKVGPGAPPWQKVYGPSGALAVWSAGEGPTVLLVHGWEGAHQDLDAFVEPLLALGHRVLSVDLPAHGHSEGDTTSIPDSARALLALEKVLGPFTAVVAHSIGCAVTAMALQQGMAAERVVMLAPPSRYVDYARGFARMAGVEPEGLIAALRDRGIDIDNIDLPAMATGFQARALIVHSQDDKVVPVASGRGIASVWPNAELLEVDGLGHKRILRDESIVWAAASFIGR